MQNYIVTYTVAVSYYVSQYNNPPPPPLTNHPFNRFHRVARMRIHKYSHNIMYTYIRTLALPGTETDASMSKRTKVIHYSAVCPYQNNSRLRTRGAKRNLFCEYAPTANFSFRRLPDVISLCALFFSISTFSILQPFSTTESKKNVRACRPNRKRISQQPVNTKRRRGKVKKLHVYTSYLRRGRITG